MFSIFALPSAKMENEENSNVPLPVMVNSLCVFFAPQEKKTHNKDVAACAHVWLRLPAHPSGG
jgi:hypothetical protein